MKMKNLLSILAILAIFGGLSAAQVIPNPIPERVLGRLPQEPFALPEARSSSPNLVEGRELWEPQGVALDASLDPPAVYVADARNNRVLAWRDARSFWNGAFADAVLGQRDLRTTNPLNPAAAFPAGMNTPVAVAVDAQGRVFVADSGNNRILRFRSAFAAEEPGRLEMVIGQTTRLGRCANQDTAPNNACVTAASGASAPSAAKLRFAASYLGGALAVSMAIDQEGNLWVTDAGNHRVLRYSREAISTEGNITPGGSIDPVVAASRVIGQVDMVSAVPNLGRLNTPSGQLPDRVKKDLIRFPSALALDSRGSLYVADDLGRVLYYPAPTHDGQVAQRLLGILVLAQGAPAPNPVNEIGLGARPLVNNIFTGGPRGLFTIDDRLFVVDTYHHRIVRYDRPEDWPGEATQFSPSMQAVWGQDTLFAGRANRDPLWEPTARSLNTPATAVFAANEVWVVDTGNNRVLAFPNLLEAGPAAEARGVLGQESFEFRAPNFIQGREFSAGVLRLVAPNGQVSDLGIAPHVAIDRSSDPPRLYIADPGNNRILGFADARKVKPGDFADLVIGQVDFYRQMSNSPFNDPAQPTEYGLLLPSAITVDAGGNLWVADTGNGRVIRFPRPFDDPGNRWQKADLVLGQPTLSTRVTVEPEAGRLVRPISMTFTGQGQLLVADVVHNRVVRYDPPFTSGQEAALVIGQPDFNSSAPGSANNQLSLPYSIAVDADDRLYVADAGNLRVQIFDRVSGQAANGPNAPVSIRLGSGSTAMQPVSVAVDPADGRIWVVDARNNRVRRFPNFFNLLAQTVIAEEVSFAPVLPLQPFQLAFGLNKSILLSGLDHRLSMHVPGIFADGPNNALLFGSLNWANGFFSVTPGGISTLRAPGVTFADGTVSHSGSVIPKDSNDLEVLVNGQPAPILRIEGNTIRYIMPWRTPTETNVEFRVRRISTDETLAYQFQSVDPASPAFLTLTSTGTPRAIRARNANGTDNTPTSPASPGTEVTLFLSGYGRLENPPEDGVASETPLPIDGTLIVGGREPQVLASTTDPNEPGVWRLRIRLPDNIFGAPAGNFAVPVVLVHRSRANGLNPVTGSVAFVATIAIRQ